MWEPTSSVDPDGLHSGLHDTDQSEQERPKSLSLPLGCGADIQQPLCSRLDCCAHGREHAPPQYLHYHPSISLTTHLFLGMGCPCKCKAIFCRQPSQHPSPGLLPSPLHAWVLILMPAYMPHSQGTHAHTGALHWSQPHPYLQLPRWHLPAGIRPSHGHDRWGPSLRHQPPHCHPLLILQSEFKRGQLAYPPMSHGIEVGGGKDICQQIVVSLYHEWCISKILFEVLGDTPLESKELEFRAVVVFL